ARVIHVRRSKHLRFRPSDDLVFEQPGRAIARLHPDAALLFEGARRRIERLAQAAGGVQQHGLSLRRRRYRHDGYGDDDGMADRQAYAPGTVALGKNSCWPSIL